MGIVRNLEYAEAQARVRARIGAMPGESQWRRMAEAGDLDQLIARMRAGGLAGWVSALPRCPDTITIEQHLAQRLQMLIAFTVRLLPARWRRLQEWLWRGWELFRAQLQTDLSKTGDQAPPRASRLLRLEPATRRRELRDADGREPPRSAWDRWLREFEPLCPRLTGRERYVVRRIQRIVHRHLRRIAALREQAARSEPVDADVQWRLRRELADELRSLLGRDPFHAGVILIYAVLELMQYERCRALLIARSRQWSMADPVVGGA